MKKTVYDYPEGFFGTENIGGAIKFAGKRLSFLTKGLAAASGAHLLADGTIKDNNIDNDDYKII